MFQAMFRWILWPLIFIERRHNTEHQEIINILLESHPAFKPLIDYACANGIKFRFSKSGPFDRWSALTKEKIIIVPQDYLMRSTKEVSNPQVYQWVNVWIVAHEISHILYNDPKTLTCKSKRCIWDEITADIGAQKLLKKLLGDSIPKILLGDSFSKNPFLTPNEWREWIDEWIEGERKMALARRKEEFNQDENYKSCNMLIKRGKCPCQEEVISFLR